MKCVNENKKLVKYICPFGIYEAIAPIMKKNEVVAYLFLSMGIEDSEESLGVPLNNAKKIATNLNEAYIKLYVEKIPAYSREKLDACAEMLPIIAEYIENNNMLYDAKQSIGQMIKEYVKNNLDKKITLADLSYHLHCSTVTLTKHFKEEFGTTIMEYVTEKRMKLASKMLIEGSYSVHEIAEKCGFSDSEYFSRCFKSYFGESPLTWKNNHRTHRRISEIHLKNQ
jgi:AraC-like DNA-binding protein